MRNRILTLILVCLCLLLNSCTHPSLINESISLKDNTSTEDQTIYNTSCSIAEQLTGISLYAAAEQLNTMQINIISPNINPVAEATFLYSDTSCILRAQKFSQDGIKDSDISGLYYDWFDVAGEINSYTAKIRCAKEATLLIWTDEFSDVIYNLAIMKDVPESEIIQLGERIIYGIEPVVVDIEEFTIYKKAETEDILAAIYNTYSSDNSQQIINTALILLDFAQSNGPSLDIEEFKNCCALWLMENNSIADDFVYTFFTAYSNIKLQAVGIIENSKNISAAENYTSEYFNNICLAIDEAISVIY